MEYDHLPQDADLVDLANRYMSWKPSGEVQQANMSLVTAGDMHDADWLRVSNLEYPAAPVDMPERRLGRPSE
jgi:hypothetical protein